MKKKKKKKKGGVAKGLGWRSVSYLSVRLYTMRP
jgi:hypothetical protein